VSLYKSILVAEDDPHDAYLLKRAFIQAGIDVHMEFVQDGEQVIHYLKGINGFADRKQHPFPELLLLDLKMPKLNGFDVLRWLRGQDGLKRLLVTVLSSSNRPTDVNRAYDLGVNSYLIKPSAFEKLSKTVEHIRDYWLEINESPDCKWSE
jgi:CheY-like chemotaxis protein